MNGARARSRNPVEVRLCRSEAGLRSIHYLPSIKDWHQSIIRQTLFPRIFVVNKASFTENARSHKLTRKFFKCMLRPVIIDLCQSESKTWLLMTYSVASNQNSTQHASPGRTKVQVLYIWPDLKSHSFSHWYPLINIGKYFNISEIQGFNYLKLFHALLDNKMELVVMPRESNF